MKLEQEAEMERSVEQSTNRWKDPSFPKSGWVCVDLYDDLDGEVERGGAAPSDLRKLCDVCGSKHIRHVHVMVHPDYAETMEAGCVCAGRLETNIDRAKDREKEFRARQKFAARKSWVKGKRFDDAAFSIKADGHKLIAFHSRGRVWKVEALPFGNWRNAILGRHTFETERDAKAAAFDALQYLKRQYAQRATSH